MIAGIDPGVSGAIAFLSMLPELGVAELVDMPVMQRGKTGNKQQINGAALGAVFRSFTDRGLKISHVYLEHVMGAPRKTGGGSVMGAASAFNFGHSFGVIEGVLGALQLPYSLITPGVWKKAANLIGAEKDMSRTRAIQLFPHCADQLERKKDIGRAEALLIAHFGRALA
ncbi:MAG TPA: crossover junction endodeoxyribonuclease [Gammaproteobacteria bacterium]|nr:crossover junction endodeoxyribonuclease [Gammaproteobacteria bacterium]